MKKRILSVIFSSAIIATSCMAISTQTVNQTNSLTVSAKPDHKTHTATVSAKDILGWNEGKVDVQYYYGRAAIHMDILKVNVPNGYVATGLTIPQDLTYTHSSGTTYPVWIHKIGDYALKGIKINGSVDLRNSYISVIGKNAFENCGITGSIALGSSLQNIREGAFVGNNVKNLYMDKKRLSPRVVKFEGNWRPGLQANGKVYVREEYANEFLAKPNFSYAKTDLALSAIKVNIPAIYKGEQSEITVEAGWAKDENLDIVGVTLSKVQGDDYYETTIQIPATVNVNGKSYDVMEIPEEGFFECGFNGIDLSHATNLVNIEDYAFFSNSLRLEWSILDDSITIPKSVRHIGSYALGYQSRNGKDYKIIFESDVVPTFGYNWSPYKFDLYIENKITAAVPTGTKYNYISAENFICDSYYIIARLDSPEYVYEE